MIAGCYTPVMMLGLGMRIARFISGGTPARHMRPGQVLLSDVLTLAGHVTERKPTCQKAQDPLPLLSSSAFRVGVCLVFMNQPDSCASPCDLHCPCFRCGHVVLTV